MDPSKRAPEAPTNKTSAPTKTASGNRPKGPITDAHIENARRQGPIAFQLGGYIYDGQPVCPSPGCGARRKGQIKFFEDGGFHCHKCGFHSQNAIDFLVEQCGWKFADAVKALSGLPYNGSDGKAVAPLAIEIVPEFTATPDPDLYQALLGCGSVERAIEFYGRWHISPEIVKESRATYIVDQTAMAKTLKQEFGPERLIASGLITDKQYFLANARYPVIEPHILPDGRVAGLQFRASETVERDIAAYKAYKAERDAVEASGEKWRKPKLEFIPKFMSLRGAPISSRCGFGLERLARLTASVHAGDARPSKIYIVEGFKDLLAARTLGLEAYGLAGTGITPVRAVCALLAPHEVHVSFDADEAGAGGRARLVAHFAQFDIKAIDHAPPDGQDITDVLVAKWAQGWRPTQS